VEEETKQTAKKEMRLSEGPFSVQDEMKEREKARRRYRRHEQSLKTEKKQKDERNTNRKEQDHILPKELISNWSLRGRGANG
jgi:hypothetical protein